MHTLFAVPRPAPLTLLIALACSGNLYAQTSIPSAPVTNSVAINIQSQPLAQALNAWAQQTRIQIVVDQALVADKTARAIKGNFTPQQAIDQLLTGSGLLATTEGNAVVIKAARPVKDTTTLAPVVVTAQAGRSGKTEGSGSYITRSTSTATGLNLSVRDTPQSVSVITQERIKDQAMPTIGEALKATPGVSFQPWDSGRANIAVRGFAVKNFQYDGVPLDTINIGPEINNTVMYDRVEVVRGATGLLSGAGNPSASVNLVRKHADSTTFTGSIEGTLGSWDHRGATVDITTPLNTDGSVRARIVANTTQQNSFIDIENTKSRTFYGVVDAELSADTRISIGASDQKNERNGVYWGGLNYWYADGTRTNWDRSKTTATNWNQWDTKIQTAFATWEHRFASEWKVRFDASYNKLSEESNLLYVYGSPDKITGQGLLSERNHYITQPTQTHLRIAVDGAFDLGGRTHEFFGGLSHSRFKGGWDYGLPGPNDAPVPVADFNHWNGDFPQSHVDPFFSDRYTTTQTGLYAATRLNLSDATKIILGARLSNYDKDLSVSDPSKWPQPYALKKKNEITPYAGLIYKLTEQWSTYASFTSIFLPQDNKRTQSGNYLDPLEGKSYEAGIKGEILAGALNVSAAVFRTDQDNYAIPDGLISGTSVIAYRTTQGVQAQGYELEVSGQIAQGWDIGAGWTQYSVKDAKNQDVTDQHPRKLLKLFTKYALGGEARGWTLGGGVNWQSQPLAVLANPVTGVNEKVGQPAYAVVDLMARHDFNAKTSMQLNIGNVLDKKYYTSGYDWVVYGQPRNTRVTLTHKF